jgi:hypothetical protein
MDPQRLKWLGAIAVSGISGLIFVVLIASLYWVQDAETRKSLMTILVQTGAINFTTVVGFWVGSSAGSQQKTDQPQPPAPHP